MWSTTDERRRREVLERVILKQATWVYVGFSTVDVSTINHF